MSPSLLTLALLLAAPLDDEGRCAKYMTGFTPPPAAVAAEKECGEGCARELAERFANGDGVERNFDIAEYFLCRAENEIAPAEFEGMLGHLQKMRSGEEISPLDFCDYVTSGYGFTYCAGVQYDRLMPQLEKRVEALRGNARALEHLNSLLERGNAFVEAETDRIGEQSRGGTGYAAFCLEAEMDAKKRFVDDLERWSRERAPAATSADSKRADQELNSAYRIAQKQLDDIGVEHTAELKRLLRDAQRAWIAYRDAFAAYYAERWHGDAASAALRRAIVTQLTRDRAVVLRTEDS